MPKHHGSKARATFRTSAARAIQVDGLRRDYRCYFLDECGQVLFPAEIGAEGPEAAKRHRVGALVMEAAPEGTIRPDAPSARNRS